MGYSQWGRKESDMTEATEHTCKIILIQPLLEDKGLECNLWLWSRALFTMFHYLPVKVDSLPLIESKNSSTDTFSPLSKN